jgi:hypothetical protein
VLSSVSVDRALFHPLRSHRAVGQGKKTVVILLIILSSLGFPFFKATKITSNLIQVTTDRHKA